VSYYPSPYSPPDVPAWDTFGLPEEVMRPARRASLLLLLLCGLALACAAIIYLFSFVSLDQMPADERQQLEQIVVQSGLDFKTYFHIAACSALVAGVILGLLGLLVRGGRRAAIYVSLVVAAILLTCTGIGILSDLANASRIGPLALVPPIGLAILLVLLEIQLINAAKNARIARAMAAQYQMQLWQSLQGQPVATNDYAAAPLPPPPATTEAPSAPSEDPK
jgi:hypothetical protein